MTPVIFSVDKKYAWGPDDFNRNHVFVVNTVYELPIGRGKKFMGDAGRISDLLIGGWQLTNTLNYSGGLPFTPSIGECGPDFRCGAVPSPTQRANLQPEQAGIPPVIFSGSRH